MKLLTTGICLAICLVVVHANPSTEPLPELRQRRAISQDYLPPLMKPSEDYLPPSSTNLDTKVAEDGYHYNTVRRLTYRARHRRDVSEIASPNNEYVPPAPPPPPPSPVVEQDARPVAATEPTTLLDQNGYHYQTVRRFKFRRNRRETDTVSKSASDEANSIAVNNVDDIYIPPASDVKPEEAKSEPMRAELGKDGYRYKTVRQIRYRHRN